MANKLSDVEVKALDEYLAKYPTLAGTALARVAHGDGAFPEISENRLKQCFQRRINARKAPAPTPTGADGEQIAITGTIAREELDALAEKARKYDYLIRAIFAGATENRKTPNTLYLNFPAVNEILNAFEPALYAEALRRH